MPIKTSSWIIELLKTLAYIFLIAFVMRTFIVQSFRVEGSSMEPNFHHGEFVLVEKISYRLKTPQRGDIIVLKAPNQPSIDFIKRIVGLPQESISITKERVFINGSLLDEPYLKNGELTQVNNNDDEIFTMSLQENEYFVLGDNRQSSKDSRSVGAIPRRDIIGRAFLVIWPFKNFGLVVKESVFASN